MQDKKPNKVKSFIISRPSIRVIILFFSVKIFPYFKYFTYFLITIFIATIIFLAIFKKTTFEQIKNLIHKEIYKIISFNIGYSEIKIDGNNRTTHEQIASIARQYLLKDDITNQIIATNIKEKIEELPWVDEVVVTVTLHKNLYINVKEHQPFAIWENDKEKYITSKDGDLISYSDNEDFENLIILTGEDAYKNAKSLFNILAIDPVISENIYSATWVGSRRWDVRFKNGLLVKLPSDNSENNMGDAWNSLIKLYNTPGALIGLKMVDLRIAKKIYLGYDDKTTKDIINTK